MPPSIGELAPTADGILLRTRAEDLTGMAQLLAGYAARRPPPAADPIL
ncbi:hypothetical protein [Plantactinospora sp. KLBMP9567]|nr:hypothetical protein [Plantactinospora sp. KLBMP9567]MDW5326118.1 hypothetical protein [Plantactinospora sp. KLBMP9567]